MTIIALTAGWVTGLVVAGGLVVVAGGLWGLLLWAVAHRRERWRAVAVVALAAVVLGAGFAAAAAWREQRVQAHPLRAMSGVSVRVVFTPSDDPKPLRASAFGGEQRWLVRGHLEEFQRARTVVRAGGSVVVLAPGPEWGRVLPGQAVQVRARVEAPQQRDLTVASLRALGTPEVVGSLPWWQRAAASVRKNFADAAGRVLGGDAAGLLPALVLGDTSRLPDPVREDFEIAGLQHLCVVSGANFTILLSVVLFVVRMLTLGPRLAALVAVGALAMFVVVARPDPSVLRAAAMGAITLLALVTGRRKQALPALCAAVIGLLAVWPELAVSAGFALSVVATAGLILLAPSWADWLRARGWWRLPAEVVAVSAGAFVVTVPIMVALTGRISVLAVLANVLVAPVIAPLTVLGACGAALACIWSPPAELVLRCTAPLLWWLLSVAERTAGLPGATVSVPGGAVGGVAATALVAIAVWALRSSSVRKLAAAVLLAVAAALIPIRIWHPGWPPGDWVLAACDVGQGDGLALALGNRSAVVIDVGPDPRSIRSCLDRLRINRIELLVLTHPHADHIGGLAGALHGRSVAALAVGPYELSGSSRTAPESVCGSGKSVRPDDGAGGGIEPRTAGNVQIQRPGDAAVGCAHRKLETSAQSSTRPNPPRAEPNPHRRGPANSPAAIAELAQQAEIPVLELSAGQVLHFGTTQLEVLAPPPATHSPDLDPDIANDRSIVLAATTAAGRVLLTGDIEAAAQHRLVASGTNLRADILKVPHHGSRTTTREFLAATRPRLALISAGTDNTFGHPHPAILTELAALGTTIARTDQHGDILVGAAPDLHTVTTRRPKSSG
ncbi:ComEC/Rec2 family competence protein [Nocardia sp. NPDC050712]|uniref:ComEC/Rec2 family competence protein n=1 Tax=Nocardia sp. NPDC050712 TaxID=3155518 RepID=UPI003410DBC4